MGEEDGEPDGRVPVNERLLLTAVAHFGERGPEGASTRAIARDAGTVMSSITYHYGGKTGLYLAAAAFVADRLLARLSPAFDAMPDPDGLAPADAAEAVASLADTVIPFMLHPDSAVLARFIVREQMAATEAYGVIRERLVEPLSGRARALVRRAGEGRWNEEEVTIKTLTIFGQFLIFRIAHATVLALTGWDRLTEERTQTIVRIVKSHIRAILTERDDR